MAHIVADRVKETASNKPNASTAFNLPDSGATGYVSFDSVMATNDTCFYMATNGTAWEVGLGTFTAGSPDTLARTTLLSSSSGSAIDFSAGGDVTVELVDPAISAGLARVFGQQEISITGTGVTATLDHMHVCSGTTADYTVTLPAVSGNTGRLIGFRMSNALTKLVTIDGNSTETIDGATTRVMWAGESAILLCDGSGWVKIAGRSKPMIASLNTGDAVTVNNSTDTKLTWTASTNDNTGLMSSTANDKITILRPGYYDMLVVTSNTTAGAASAGGVYPLVWKNGASLAYGSGWHGGTGVYARTQCNHVANLAKDDYLEAYMLQYTGTSMTTTGDRFIVTEVVTW